MVVSHASTPSQMISHAYSSGHVISVSSQSPAPHSITHTFWLLQSVHGSGQTAARGGSSSTPQAPGPVELEPPELDELDELVMASVVDPVVGSPLLLLLLLDVVSTIIIVVPLDSDDIDSEVTLVVSPV